MERSRAQTSAKKKCIVNEFLEFLGATEVPLNETHLPVVRLLVGDTNISYDVARECAAEAVDPANAQTALDRWVPVSTTNKLSGDVMWCYGAFATEMVIPVGKSYRKSGVRNDDHDTVAAKLVVPFADIAAGEPSGAAQPAGSDISEEDDTESPSHWPPPRSETPPALSDDELEARQLDRELRDRHAAVQVDELNDNPAHAQTLGRILFQRKTVMHNGQKLEYVASKRESVKALRTLLSMRNRFLEKQRIPARDLNGKPTVLTTYMRTQFLQNWKARFHGQALQQRLQFRDSWKESRQRKGRPWSGGAVQPTAGKGKQKGKKGPNKDAVQKGKHSRFSRYLQRDFGSKNIALAIVFTGDVDLHRLEAAQASQPGASQPGDWRAKARTRVARMRYKHGKMLEKNIANISDPGRKMRAELQLSREQRDLLHDFRSGSALQEYNNAIIAYGHGRLRNPEGAYMDIGGSTGGVTREFLGIDPQPNAEAWMQRAWPRPSTAASSSLGAVPKRQ